MEKEKPWSLFDEEPDSIIDLMDRLEAEDRERLRKYPFADLTMDDWYAMNAHSVEDEEDEKDEEDTEKLIAWLVDYCRRLEKRVIGLRRWVRRLTWYTPEYRANPSNLRVLPRFTPFFDLHSDLYDGTYIELKAYEKYRHLFKKLE